MKSAVSVVGLVLVAVVSGAVAQEPLSSLRDRASFHPADKEISGPTLPSADNANGAGGLPVNSYTAAPPPPAPASPTVATPIPVVERPAYLTRLDREYEVGEDATTGGGAETGEPGLSGMLLRAAMWLCMICAAILVVAYLLRKVGRRTPLLAGQQYGEVLGRLYLTPRVCLHYVRSGDRVLLIGVAQNTAQLITEFDAETFLAGSGSGEASGAPSRRFLERLRANLAHETGETSDADDEIAALRGDIQRLRQHLQERARDARE